MSLPGGNPVRTPMSGCDMDLIGVGNCPQMRCKPTSLYNRLYADGHVHHWCGSKDPSTVQLLIDTTTVLQ